MLVTEDYAKIGQFLLQNGKEDAPAKGSLSNHLF